MTESQRNPLIIAHRGASGHAPENTMTAFRQAVDLGADGLELDVTMSRDRRVVVIHDDTLDRTTTGKGLVHETEWRALHTLDAGRWFAPEFAGERIPLLQEVLELVSPALYLNVEIKSGPLALETLAAVVDLLQRHRSRANTCITSFDEAVIRSCLQHDPDMTCGLIFEADNLHRAFSGPWRLLSSHYPLITDAFMEQSKTEHRSVFTWTVNSVDVMQRMVSAGVDGIITNFPDRLAAMLNPPVNATA